MARCCPADRRAADDRGARSVQERARLQVGGRARGKERTENIWYTVVTLEVSKLSGRLNADACCRELKGGHTVRGEAAGQQTGATASSVQGRARLRIGCRAR